MMIHFDISILLGLIVSLGFLVWSADLLTDRSEKIGLGLGMNPLLIGVILLGVGTSLPELASSVAAVIDGKLAFPVDNTVGSNIANISLVGGLILLFANDNRLVTKKGYFDVFFMLLITLSFFFFTIDKKIVIEEGCALIGLLLFFVIVSIIKTRNNDENSDAEKATIADGLVLVVSIAMLVTSASFTVGFVEKLAVSSGIDMSVLTGVLVALGTSLPEVVVTITALKKGQSRMAVGNVIGSNIFNIGAVTGISAFVPLNVSSATEALIVPLVALSALFIIMIFIQSLFAKKAVGVTIMGWYIIFIFYSLL